MELNREELYSRITGLCENFYNQEDGKHGGQAEQEIFFLHLWRNLAELFNGQQADYGEFWNTSWDKIKELRGVK